MLGRGKPKRQNSRSRNRKVERSLQQSEFGTKHSTDSTALYRTLFYCCLILFIAGVIVQLETRVTAYVAAPISIEDVTQILAVFTRGCGGVEHTVQYCALVLAYETAVTVVNGT